jgi:hypothetical protein
MVVVVETSDMSLTFCRQWSRKSGEIGESVASRVALVRNSSRGLRV